MVFVEAKMKFMNHSSRLRRLMMSETKSVYDARDKQALIADLTKIFEAAEKKGYKIKQIARNDHLARQLAIELIAMLPNS